MVGNSDGLMKESFNNPEKVKYKYQLVKSDIYILQAENRLYLQLNKIIESKSIGKKIYVLNQNKSFISRD